MREDSVLLHTAEASLAHIPPSPQGHALPPAEAPVVAGCRRESVRVLDPKGWSGGAEGEWASWGPHCSLTWPPETACGLSMHLALAVTKKVGRASSFQCGSPFCLDQVSQEAERSRSLTVMCWPVGEAGWAAAEASVLVLNRGSGGRRKAGSREQGASLPGRGSAAGMPRNAQRQHATGGSQHGGLPDLLPVRLPCSGASSPAWCGQVPPASQVLCDSSCYPL